MFQMDRVSDEPWLRTPLSVRMSSVAASMSRFYSAGTPDSVFPLTPDDLVRASGGEPADFALRR